MTKSLGLPKLPPENTEPWDGTPKEIAQEYFPDATPNQLSEIIWGLTGFPHFWHIPEDGNTPLQCFHTQLREARTLLNNGVSIHEQLYLVWDKPWEELKERTRVRAYYIWLEQGKPEGKHLEHWEQAVEEWHDKKWQ